MLLRYVRQRLRNGKLEEINRNRIRFSKNFLIGAFMHPVCENSAMEFLEPYLKLIAWRAAIGFKIYETVQ
jgi:hypothetical protein